MDASTSTLFTLVWLLLCGVACAAVAFVPDRLSAAGRLRRYAASPLLLVAVAFIIRLVPAVAVKLTPDALIRFDIDSYRIVGSLLRSGQSIYTDPTRHPYLPFEAYAMGGASWLSYHTGDPFTLIVKLPAILADALIPAVLLAWTGRGLARRGHAGRRGSTRSTRSPSSSSPSTGSSILFRSSSPLPRSGSCANPAPASPVVISS